MRDLPGGRRKSREILFRVLFEAEVGGEDPLELLEYTLGRYHLTADGRDYAVRVLGIWAARREEIDARIRGCLQNWDLGRLSVTVRSILRLAVAELLGPAAGVDSVPAVVVLDQAIELARKYGEDGADGFVNGILDPIGADLRPDEIGGRGKGR